MKRLKRLDDAVPLIRERAEFTSGERKTPYGNFTSMRGETRTMGVGLWTPERAYLPLEYCNSLAHATYIVRSYDTPMAWWVEQPPMDDADAVELWLANGQVGFWVMPSVSYSNTTSNHQSIIATAIDPGVVVGRTFTASEWGTAEHEGQTGWWNDKREYVTEYRQRGWGFKHKYKNRGENADGPSVERYGY